MGVLSAHSNVQLGQRAMVFIDGTNFFHRLDAAKIQLVSLSRLIRHCDPHREIVRVYLYTTQPKYERALEFHGPSLSSEVRIVFGEAIPTGDGNYREKGVDALLVADLIYHAAVRNYQQAILFSADQDFAHALKRVEDFGCRTMVVSVAASTPSKLREAADETIEVEAKLLLENGWAKQA
jgi:uncharacterized LabA/DUF88 family protein